MAKKVYFKVKREADGKMFRYGRGNSLFLIANELFTEREYKQYSVPDKANRYIHPEWVERIELARNDVYCAFGARFEVKK